MAAESSLVRINRQIAEVGAAFWSGEKRNREREAEEELRGKPMNG